MAESLSTQQLSDDLKKSGSPWEMDPNTSMALLTEDERRRRLGFVPAPDDISLEEALQLDQTEIIITAQELA
ncbi:MAG: hypothetical protein V7677_19700, partial [Motiliproteus sp.]